MLEIDRIAHASRLHQVSPHLRVTLPLVLLVILPFTEQWQLGVLILMLASFINLWHGEVPAALYLKSLLAPAFFVATAVIGILLVTSPGSETVLWQWHGFGAAQSASGLYEGGLSLYLTQASLHTSILTISRAYGSLGLVYLIAFHTTIWELGQYMLRARLPKTFVELFVLCYRFIFILLEEGYEMVHAQDLRLGYIDLKCAFSSLSLLISQLFLRTLMRVRYMEESLEMRLYQGEFLLDSRRPKRA